MNVNLQLVQGFVHANGRKTSLGPADILKLCPSCTSVLLELFVPKSRKKGSKQVRLNSAQVAELHKRILAFVKKPVSPAEIAAHVGMAVPAVSHHLHRLVKAKQLKGKGRSSNRRYYP